MAAATVDDVVFGDDDDAAAAVDAVGCDGGKNKWDFYHQLSECTAAVAVAAVAIAAAGSDDCDQRPSYK